MFVCKIPLTIFLYIHYIKYLGVIIIIFPSKALFFCSSSPIDEYAKGLPRAQKKKKFMLLSKKKKVKRKIRGLMFVE